MKPRSCADLVLVLLALTTLAPSIRSQEKRAILDCGADDRLLDTRFVRFGPVAGKAIQRERGGVHFRLPPLKDPGHSGIYSFVALAGDFEISAQYVWVGVPVPKVGYGASCGITVDTNGPAGSISLARATLPVKKAGYIVTRSVGERKKGNRYETEHYPTNAMSGRLALRREKAELICLTGDGIKGDLVELCRVPFTDATIRQVRIYGDPGASDTGLDARILNLRVVAEEITGGIPARDADKGWGWWPWLAAAVVLGGGMIYWRGRSAPPP